jgi:hypothetical protein
MSPNFGYVPIGAKTRDSVCHTPRQMVRVCEIHVFLPPVASCIKVADLVSPCARRTLISVSARQPSSSSVYCAQRREVADVFLFHPSISYLFRYFAWATALTFVEYSFSYFFHLESTVLAVTTPAPHCHDGRASFEFSGRRATCTFPNVSERRTSDFGTRAPNRPTPSTPPRSPIHGLQWRNERRTCISPAFSQCQVDGCLQAKHLIDQFSSKFLWPFYSPPIDMISGFNTWNPEVQSPPTTRIRLPPAFVITFKWPSIQFEC